MPEPWKRAEFERTMPQEGQIITKHTIKTSHSARTKTAQLSWICAIAVERILS